MAQDKPRLDDDGNKLPDKPEVPDQEEPAKGVKSLIRFR
jgi:hypothetical protein